MSTRGRQQTPKQPLGPRHHSAFLLLYLWLRPGTGLALCVGAQTHSSQQCTTIQCCSEAIPDTARSLSGNHTALQCPSTWSRYFAVCKPQQKRQIFLCGEMKPASSKALSYTLLPPASAGTPAACLFPHKVALQSINLLGLLCMTRNTITSVPQEDAGVNTFLHG